MPLIGKVFRLPELNGDERIIVNREGARGYLRIVRHRFKQWLFKAVGSAPKCDTNLEAPSVWSRLDPSRRGWAGPHQAGDYPEHDDATGNYLSPIIIPGCGRDGSTLLMQLLGSSRQIAFDREGECENRFLTYLVRWAQLLEADPVLANGIEVRRSLFSLDAPLGHLPWVESCLLEERTPGHALWKPCFLAAWRELSRTACRRLAAETGAATQPVRYYAEKSSPWLCAQLTGLLPFKEVYTLRDPRDVWLSVLAYNVKRGVSMFGRLPGQSDADFLPTFLEGQKAKLAYIARLKESDTVAIVRYENMVTDLPSEARRLGDFLDVPLDAEAVQRQTKHYRYHMTSASPTASVYRWKRELDPAVNQQFVAALKPYLGRLGYDE